jgi:hypothetical protein
MLLIHYKMLSLGTVVKNTILVILIILIGHFIVKNTLMDKQLTKPIKIDNNIKDETIKELSTQLPLTLDTKPVSKEEVSSVANNPTGIPSSMVLDQMQGGLDKAKEELLKFIDDDDDTMTSFFNSGTQLKAVPSDNCKLKTQDNIFPLSTTCDPIVLDLKKHDDGKETVQSISNTSNDKKGLMILKEYKNENVMNGGELYGGLNAYDAYNTNFELFQN